MLVILFVIITIVTLRTNTMNFIKNITLKQFTYFTLQVLLIIAVYFGVKTYTQRNLAQDIPPTLSATLLSGQAFNLQAQRDKPLLLHFWATWCPVCKLEQSSIQSISNKHNVITVAMQSGDKAELNSYMHNEKLSFPVIVDNDGAITNRFGIQAVPVSFIINTEGKIVFIESGFTSSWGLKLRLWLANFL